MGCICPKPKVEGGTSVDYVEFGKYIGERNCCGQRNGHGQYYYDNGDMYDGTWKRNRKHGYGKYTFCNGKMLVNQQKFVNILLIILFADYVLKSFRFHCSNSHFISALKVSLKMMNI